MRWFLISGLVLALSTSLLAVFTNIPIKHITLLLAVLNLSFLAFVSLRRRRIISVRDINPYKEAPYLYKKFIMFVIEDNKRGIEEITESHMHSRKFTFCNLPTTMLSIQTNMQDSNTFDFVFISLTIQGRYIRDFVRFNLHSDSRFLIGGFNESNKSYLRSNRRDFSETVY